MRVLKEFNYGPFKASIFNWNGKFLLKVETPSMEQTYKIPETELFSVEEVTEAANEQVLEKITKAFLLMKEAQQLLIAPED